MWKFKGIWQILLFHWGIKMIIYAKSIVSVIDFGQCLVVRSVCTLLSD